MNTSQIIGFSAGFVSLIGTIIGLTKSLYEIKKLKEEIRREKGAKIYTPSLEEIILLQGDINKFEQLKKPSKLHAYDYGTALMELFLCSFQLPKIISIPIPAGQKIPLSVIKSFKISSLKLKIFGGSFFIILMLLIYNGLPLIIPISFLTYSFFNSVKTKWFINALLMTFVLSHLCFFLISKIFGFRYALNAHTSAD